MNKLFIVFLAVCLVSVHAFVKRDAPAPAAGSTELQNIAAQLQKLQEEIGKKFSESFNPEEWKKGVDNIIDNVAKAIEDLKPKTDAPK